MFNQFPKFIVLQVHAGTTLNSFEKRWASLPIEPLELLFDEGKDNGPKLGCLLKFLFGDEIEPIHDLLIGHVLAPLLVAEDDVVGVPGVVQGKVNLIEVERVVVVEVGVPAGVDLPHLQGHHHPASDLVWFEGSDQNSFEHICKIKL